TYDDDGLIFVDVMLHGPTGRRSARFLVDTGAAMTSVQAALTDALGYGAHMAIRRTRLVGAGGPIEGYSLPLQKIEAMGAASLGLEVVCEDIEPDDVDGLIGVNFLRDHVLTIDYPRGEITLAP